MIFSDMESTGPGDLIEPHEVGVAPVDLIGPEPAPVSPPAPEPEPAEEPAPLPPRKRPRYSTPQASYAFYKWYAERHRGQLEGELGPVAPGRHKHLVILNRLRRLAREQYELLPPGRQEALQTEFAARTPSAPRAKRYVGDQQPVVSDTEPETESAESEEPAPKKRKAAQAERELYQRLEEIQAEIKHLFRQTKAVKRGFEDLMEKAALVAAQGVKRSR